MKILLIDNYDSFTFNLYHYISSLKKSVDVVRNDKITDKEILKKKYNKIVISPGPGNPNQSGNCIKIVKSLHKKIPILGVCLGHQIIGQVFGSKIIQAKKIMHGKTSKIKSNKIGILKNIPTKFEATRYHSLIIDKKTLSKNLEITAETEDGIIMGIQHKKYNVKWINALKRLRDLGNSVIVVEHDTETIENADHIIDLGPEAGINGGYIVAQGGLETILKNKDSITGNYLSKKKNIPIPNKRRMAKNGRFLEILGATGNNLKNINLKIPLGTFTCVTGVSGSGKSTLLLHTLYNALNLILNNNKSRKLPKPFKNYKGVEQIDKIIDIDQSPIRW